MKQHLFKKIILVFSIAMLISSLIGCSAQETKLSPTGSFDFIDYKFNKTTTVDMQDVSNMTSITKEVIQRTTTGKSNVNITGVNIKDVLEKNSIDILSLDSMRLEALDGYSMEIPSDVFKSKSIYLVYGIDGKELVEEAPVWVVIPDERAMYWVKNIKAIHLNETSSEETINVELSKIIFFETLANTLESTTYNQEDIVKCSDLLEKANLSKDISSFGIFAIDGLEKNETFDIINSSYLTTSGEYAPMLTGKNVLEGMQVKNILSLTANDTAIISKNMAQQLLNDTVSSNFTGVSIIKLFEHLNLSPYENYTFASTDGYSKTLTNEEIQNGIIFTTDEGQLCTYFDGLEKNTMVRDLLSITAE